MAQLVQNHEDKIIEKGTTFGSLKFRFIIENLLRCQYHVFEMVYRFSYLKTRSALVQINFHF
jgi:hypothetical protein